MSKYDAVEIGKLPLSSAGILAETPCGVCASVAVLTIRRDGWPQVRCTGKDCKYMEIGAAEKSAHIIMSGIVENTETRFMRADIDDVKAAIGIVNADIDLQIVELADEVPDDQIKDPIPAQPDLTARDAAPEKSKPEKTRPKKSKPRQAKAEQQDDDIGDFYEGV